MNIKIKRSRIGGGLLILAILILMCIGFRSTLISDSEVDFWSDDSRNPVNFGAIARIASFSVVITLSLILIYAYAKERTEKYWIPKMGDDLTEIPENTPFIVMAQRKQAEGLFLRLALLDPEDSDFLSEFELKNFFIKEKFLDIEKKEMEKLPEVNRLLKAKKRPKYEIKESKHGEEEISAEYVYYVYDAESEKPQNK